MDSEKDKNMIRAFRKEDMETLCAIAKRAYAGIFSGFEKQIGRDALDIWMPDAENSRSVLLKQIAEKHPEWLHVCERNGKIVGFIMFQLDYDRKLGTINSNAADPLAGEKGVGHEMYTFALDYFQKQGMKMAMVHTGLDEAHAPARKAYERMGFDRKLPEVLYFKMLDGADGKDDCSAEGNQP